MLAPLKKKKKQKKTSVIVVDDDYSRNIPLLWKVEKVSCLEYPKAK